MAVVHGGCGVARRICRGRRQRHHLRQRIGRRDGRRGRWRRRRGRLGRDMLDTLHVDEAHRRQNARRDEQGREADADPAPADQTRALPGTRGTDRLRGLDPGRGRRGTSIPRRARRMAGRQLPDAVVLGTLKRRAAGAAKLRAGKGSLTADRAFHEGAHAGRAGADPFL